VNVQLLTAMIIFFVRRTMPTHRIEEQGFKQIIAASMFGRGNRRKLTLRGYCLSRKNKFPAGGEDMVMFLIEPLVAIR
jgi:hypothetical protein